MTEITQPIINELTLYDPETGSLIWKYRDSRFFSDGYRTADHNAKLWNNRYAGREALTAKNIYGYFCGRVLGHRCLKHRLIWFLCYGYWPKGEIDHINGNKEDNRICNLRDVSKSENMRNLIRREDNNSGKTGVHWDKSKNKWVASISKDGRQVKLGTFEKYDDAVCKRLEFERMLGYHSEA